MDDRGRLAQSLKRQDATRLRSAARALVAKFRRFQRVGLHWFGPLLESQPPRGTGALAVTLLLLGTVWYGAVKGGHVNEFSAYMRDACDNAASAAGMRVSALAVTGNAQMSREEILSQAAITGRSALPCIDAAAVRRKLLDNPWLSEVTVLKLYPGGLRIDLNERVPMALWQKEGAVSVIATDGTVLDQFTGGRFALLPLVVGKGADRAGKEMLERVARFPDLAPQVESLVLVAERRWNMRMRNGVDVRLPENDVEAALKTLVRLDEEKKILSRDIVAIDLRQPDRVTVRLTDGAAAAREEANKPKPKKKGGAA